MTRRGYYVSCGCSRGGSACFCECNDWPSRELDSAVVRVAARQPSEPQFVDADEPLLRSICKENN